MFWTVYKMKLFIPLGKKIQVLTVSHLEWNSFSFGSLHVLTFADFLG